MIAKSIWITMMFIGAVNSANDREAAADIGPKDKVDGDIGGEQTGSAFPLIDNAFRENLTELRIIELSGSGINLMIQLGIGILTFSKMHRARNTRSDLEYMFIAAFVLALIANISFALFNVLKWRGPISIFTSFMPFVVFVCSNSMFFSSILATLVLRLHIVFKGSIFKVSKRTLSMFIAIGIVYFLSVSVAVGGAVMWSNGNERGLSAVVIALGIAIFWYLVGSALAVRVFARNMSKLARTQKNTLRLNNFDISKLPTLNDRQIKLLNLSAKYILLYIVSISFTVILTQILFHVVSAEMSGLWISADININLFCIYLQFNFADAHYRVCCRCMDTRCRNMVEHRTQSVMHSMTLEIVNSLTPPAVSHREGSSNGRISMNKELTDRDVTPMTPPMTPGDVTPMTEGSAASRDIQDTEPEPSQSTRL